MYFLLLFSTLADLLPLPCHGPTCIVICLIVGRLRMLVWNLEEEDVQSVANLETHVGAVPDQVHQHPRRA